MHDFLMSLISWGTEAIVWVQGFRTPVLDGFFRAVTFLGEEEFYFLILPLLYWVFNKHLSARLAYVLLPSVYLNNWLKDLFSTPRPDPARVARLVEETTDAFPSGHTQNSTVLFGFLAAPFRRWLLWVLSALLIIGVALSRVYLGIHYPQDTLGGFIFGTATLLLFLWLEKPVSVWLGQRTLAVQLGLAALVPIFLAMLHPIDGCITPMITLAGFGVANLLERRWIRFRVDGPWRQRTLRFLVGIALTAIAYFGLDAVFPEGLLFQVVRYGCVSLTVGLIAPWVFVKAGLAAPEEEKAPEALT